MNPHDLRLGDGELINLNRSFICRALAVLTKVRCTLNGIKLTDALSTPPGDVELAPYFPDTPLFRYTQAFYHDRMTLVDSQIGAVIEQLKEDGVYENTIIFYFEIMVACCRVVKDISMKVGCMSH